MATISTHLPATRPAARPAGSTTAGTAAAVTAATPLRAQLPWIVLSVSGGIASAVLAAAWLVANIHPL